MAISATAFNPNTNTFDNYVRYTPKGVDYIIHVLQERGFKLNG